MAGSSNLAKNSIVDKLKTPVITIDTNPNEETAAFYYALHNAKRPWQRKKIFGFKDFQPLKQALETGGILDEKQEKKIISIFLGKFREPRRDQLDKFIEYSKSELDKKAAAALTELARLMDYQWPNSFPGYKVVPVLLPFSPFGNNVFFFSILGIAQGVAQKSLLDVTIHEISHMIFFEILGKKHPELVSYRNSNSINVPIDYLKEILAPVLMNQPSLKILLDLSQYPNGYLGNTDIEQIYVLSDDLNEKVQISKYFQQFYERMRYQEHKTFLEVLDEMIKLIQPMEIELARRGELWNEFGIKIIKDETILAEYSKPIIIGHCSN